MRVATAEDVPALSALCRDCFPDSPRWVLGSGRRWWSSALACADCEVWVAETARGLQGFVLFLLDEHGWTRKMTPTLRQRITRGFVLLVAPALLLSRARALLRPKTDHGVDGADDRLRQHERLFIELIGVAAHARGSGMGRALVAFAQRRAAQLGLRGTCYRVDRRNGPMIALMRSSGLRIVRKDRNGYLFTGRTAPPDRATIRAAGT